MARKYVVSEQICYRLPFLRANDENYSKEFDNKDKACKLYDELIKIANRHFMNNLVSVTIALRTYDMDVNDEYGRHSIETLEYWDNK